MKKLDIITAENLSKRYGEKVVFENLSFSLPRKVPVYLLDEPIAGLDPKFKRDLIKAIRSNIDDDATLIISSHLLRDLDPVIDYVAVMKKNKIITADLNDICACRPIYAKPRDLEFDSDRFYYWYALFRCFIELCVCISGNRHVFMYCGIIHAHKIFVHSFRGMVFGYSRTGF